MNRTEHEETIVQSSNCRQKVDNKATVQSWEGFAGVQTK
jgi:hypothetical protein